MKGNELFVLLHTYRCNLSQVMTTQVIISSWMCFIAGFGLFRGVLVAKSNASINSDGRLSLTQFLGSLSHFSNEHLFSSALKLWVSSHGGVWPASWIKLTVCSSMPTSAQQTSTLSSTVKVRHLISTIRCSVRASSSFIMRRGWSGIWGRGTITRVIL